MCPRESHRQTLWELRGPGGNTSLMAFKTMFGAKGYELLSLDREEDGSWTCYTPIFNSMDDCIKVPAPWPDGLGDGDNSRAFDERMFELIEDLDETGCIMCSAGKPMVGGGGNKRSKGHSGEMMRGRPGTRSAHTLLRAVDDVAGAGLTSLK